MFTRFLPLFALLLALPLAACATDETEVTTTDETVDPVVTPDPVDPVVTDGTAEPVTAEATLDAVADAGGLTSLPVDAATANIDSWISQLEGNADAAPVVEGLRTLRGQINAADLDGAAIGATLSQLGEGTSTAGEGAGNAALIDLGKALSEAGAMLTGDDA